MQDKDFDKGFYRAIVLEFKNCPKAQMNNEESCEQSAMTFESVANSASNNQTTKMFCVSAPSFHLLRVSSKQHYGNETVLLSADEGAEEGFLRPLSNLNLHFIASQNAGIATSSGTSLKDGR